jgi:uncharacterized protein (TIGR04255 family)
LLFEEFIKFPNKDATELPIMQIPKHIRDRDFNLRYQPFYRGENKRFAFSIGPHSIAFSSLHSYAGWAVWMQFFVPIIAKIQERDIIKTVERIGVRYLNLFDHDILDQINAEIKLDEKDIKGNTNSFHTEFDHNEIHTILNFGNAAVVVDGIPTQTFVIDIDCIFQLNNCPAGDFFQKYKDILEKTHGMNERIFFGLLKPDLLQTLDPEY